MPNNPPPPTHSVSVPGNEHVGDEKIHGGDEEGEQAAGKANPEEVHEGQLVALLLGQARCDYVRRSTNQCSIP